MIQVPCWLLMDISTKSSKLPYNTVVCHVWSFENAQVLLFFPLKIIVTACHHIDLL